MYLSKTIILCKTMFCFTTFCGFFQTTSQFCLPKTVYLLEQRTVTSVFTVFQWIKIFSLREFYKYQDKCTSEKAMSDEYSGWIRTFQPACNNLLDHLEACSLAWSWWKICVFCCLILDAFHQVAAFSWSNWEHYLLKLIVWFSVRSS